MTTAFPYPRKTKTTLLLLSVFVVPLVTVCQDFLESRYHHYPFYISESLLFKVFWVLFLPVALLHAYGYKKSGRFRVPSSGIWGKVLFVLTSSLMHMLLYALVVYALSALLLDHTYAISQTLAYTLSEDSYKYMLIYGFIAAFYGRGNKVQGHLAETETEPVPGYPDHIVVGSGRNHIIVAVPDIISITARSPYIAVQAGDKIHLHTETLKGINEKLDPAQFVRVHKSAIVNLAKVLSYKSRLNGDYDILLSNGKEQRLSRSYVAAFRKAFGKGTSA